MKKRHLLGVPALLAIICTFFSCDNDIPAAIQPSTDLINVEGEGGEAKVTFHKDDWIIDRIENRSGGNEYISGDIYSADGKEVAKNTQLQLSGLGTLESGWKDHGFIITRERTDELIITIMENWTEDDFSFAVIIQAGVEEKEIVINQKKSQGYTFSHIEYSLEKGDGDKTYEEKNVRSYPYTEEPDEYVVLPFTGMYETAYFTFNEPAGIYWHQQNEVFVKVPVDIDTQTGEITLGSNETLFTSTPESQESPFLYKAEKVTVSAGYPIITVNVTYRKRQVTYHATLINKRTGAEKVITGKWIQDAPTGKYALTADSYPRANSIKSVTY